MSRFHDEFFRQGSPAHDALMIKCLSKKGIDGICAQLNVFQSWIESRKRLHETSNISVMICALRDGCRTVRVGSTEKFLSTRSHGDHEKYCVLDNSYSDGCPGRLDCAFARDRSEFPTDRDVLPKVSFNTVIRKKETEAIMRNGTFIIGYADAVIDICCEMSVSLEIENGWIWENAINDENEIKILVEAKPKLDSIGEVIRQLKTYMQCIYAYGHHYDIRPVIATYTKLNDDALEYLANEGISVVVFEEAP
jgi:hypothetical protein